MENQIIYVYSTESLMYNKTIHKPTGDVNFKPWFKIGMTTQENADDRIIQQDMTSNPEKLITRSLLCVENVTACMFLYLSKIYFINDCVRSFICLIGNLSHTDRTHDFEV
jgi:hypothetical protein